MSRIQSVSVNYQQNFKKNRSLLKSNSKLAFSPSFGNDIVVSEDLLNGVRSRINESLTNSPLRKLTNFLSVKFAKNEGEIQNQMINASLTTTLAPLIVGFNPISHEDPATKKYTALRYPVSATLAVSTGLAMTIAINNYMNKMGSEGFLSSIDGRMKPNAQYLKLQFNREYKNAENKEAFLKEFKPKDFNPEGKSKKEIMKVYKENYVKKVQEAREKLFTALLGENPKKISIKEATKEISVDGKVMGKDIPKLGTEAELNEYLQKENLHNRTFGDFMKEHFKFEFHEEGPLKDVIKKSTIDEKIDSVKAMDFLRAIGIVGKETKGGKGEIDEVGLKRIVSQLRQETHTEKDIAKAINPKLLKETGAKILADAIGEQASVLDQLGVGGIQAKEEKMTLGQLLKVLKGKTESLEDLMKKPMSEILEQFAEPIKLKGEEYFAKNIGMEGFSKNILNNAIKRFGTDFKDFKMFTGIGFNIITTVINCNILNWLYPRIVNALFPALAKDPSDNKGGNE